MRLVESMQKEDPEEYARPDRATGSEGVLVAGGERAGRARGECVRKGRSLETSRRAAVLRTVRAAVDRSGCPREEYVGRRNV